MSPIRVHPHRLPRALSATALDLYGRLEDKVRRTVDLRSLDPDTVPEAVGGYVNGLQVESATSLLFISGQIPQSRDGAVPLGIENQCRLVWANVTAVLEAADMSVSNLVKITTFLSDRAHADANTAIRREALGDHQPALTVVVAEIWDPSWLIEIEAIAAR